MINNVPQNDYGCPANDYGCPAEMAEMAEIAMLNIYLPYLLFLRDQKKQQNYGKEKECFAFR